MLTRLKVNGFKNLVDVDVRFGPFTCIAGVNGSGKSNLFDAIRFLAALAEKPLTEAAQAIVRGSGGRSGDIRSLFHRVGDQYAEEMSFEAEMIVPAEGVDDLGQPMKATATVLRYELILAFHKRDDLPPHGPLRVVHEQLSVGSEAESPRFHREPAWSESAVKFSAVDSPNLISTAEEADESEEDAVSRGFHRVQVENADHPHIVFEGLAELMPRTVLSLAFAEWHPTVALAKQEMRSWRVLHLNPAAMREPDDVYGPTQIGDDGAHVAAALYSIAHMPPTDGRDPYEAKTSVYARVANRIRRLIGDVWELTVERSDSREELTLYVTDREGTRHSARALSDGTLRFLALATIEEQQQPGVICIEEPENGLHPGRIQSLLELLQAIAMDTRYPIEEGNPLRQVIISTHSPSAVMRVPGDSLVVSELRDTVRDGKRFTRAHFSGLANTWRDPVPSRTSLALGTLLAYLNPEGYRPLPAPDPEREPDADVRVMDRDDVRQMLSPHSST